MESATEAKPSALPGSPTEPPNPATKSLAAASLAARSASARSWNLNSETKSSIEYLRLQTQTNRLAVSVAFSKTAFMSFNISPGVGSSALVDSATRPLTLSWSKIIT